MCLPLENLASGLQVPGGNVDPQVPSQHLHHQRDHCVVGVVIYLFYRLRLVGLNLQLQQLALDVRLFPQWQLQVVLPQNQR